MFKKYVSYFLSVMCFFNYFGQGSEKIVTDRPSQTEVPTLVSGDYLQLEVGFQREYSNGDMYFQYPSILWKYSFCKSFELRFLTEYLGFKKIDLNQVVGNEEGFSPLTFGFITQILKQNGLIPNLSITSHFTLPYIGNDFFRPNKVVPRFRIVANHALNERFDIFYNFGMQWGDEFKVPVYMYTFLIAYSLTNKLSMFTELYGYFKQNTKPDNRFDTGFSYLLDDNHQLDLSVGVGISSNYPSNYISIGYSFRFKTKKSRNEEFK